MRLKVSQLPKHKHTKLVTGVGWTPENELFSCSDDKTVIQWKLDGEPGSKVCDLESYVTDFHWHSTVRSVAGAASVSGQSFAIGCSDGTFRLMTKTGRTEKVVEAHQGAVTCLRWNYEGTALVTAGEDGFLKQWSPNGNLRSKIAQSDRAVYSMCWSPDSQSILYTSGRFLTIKPLSASEKETKWRGHDSPITTVDWNPVTNLIVTGAEDCRYKVWDTYGRCLFSSKPFEFPVTSARWCPSGEYFVVGSFNLLCLCDKTGWAHSRSQTNTGSINAIDWTSDGTHLAAAGSNGAVCFASIVERSLEWKNYEVKINDNNQISVRDVLSENKSGEELEFGHRVIDMAMGCNHLVVATAKTCSIYSTHNLSTPHIVDVKGTVNLILLAPSYIVLVDNIMGIQVLTYEGRLVSNPRVPGLNPVFLKRGNIAASDDCIALIDRINNSQIIVLDLATGRPMVDFKHDQEIAEVLLSQSGLVHDRKLVFIDRNRELFITELQQPKPFKLATTVDSAAWHENTEQLVALSDGKLLVWHCPQAVYVDPDFVVTTRLAMDASVFGKAAQILSFCDSRVTVRRADGALHAAAVSPFPTQLLAITKQSQWARAERLCRLLKEDFMWAILAVMAIEAQQLDTAEAALAALSEVDKLRFIQRVRSMPRAEQRSAHLALYRRRPEEAEAILLQGRLVYAAIRLNIDLYRFKRALELAVSNKSHIDTVLAYRQQYLQSMGRQESDARFIDVAAQVTINWDDIRKRESEDGLPEPSTNFASSESAN